MATLRSSRFRSYVRCSVSSALYIMPRPELAIAEMLRIARKAIFVCDGNNFGQGGTLSRFLKQVINSLGLWPAANLMKTCETVHLMNTMKSEPNMYRTSPHIALLRIIHRK